MLRCYYFVFSFPANLFENVVLDLVLPLYAHELVKGMPFVHPFTHPSVHPSSMHLLTCRRTYGYGLVNGNVQRLGNTTVEPPSLFRGRGVHPKMGTIKTRVPPEVCLLGCISCACYRSPGRDVWSDDPPDKVTHTPNNPIARFRTD